MRYGHNRYEVAYQGDSSALTDGLASYCSSISKLDPDKFGNQRIELRLIGDDARRSAISAINNAVEMVSFKPMLMSMSDIFIHAVQESNETVPPEFNPENL